MCYQTKWLKCGIPLSTGVNAVGAIALPSHRHRSLSLHLFPVLWPGTWISNCNKPRKPSSTRDHLNNRAEVQILFDFMIAALPGTQQPHAERFIAPRNPLPRGAAGHMNHLKTASPFLLGLTTNKRANPEIHCFNSSLLWSLSRLLLSLCALLLAGMR